MKDTSKNRVTRRDFGKVTAAAGTFAVLGAKGASAADKPLKVGLLGCGGRGTQDTMNMLAGNDGVELVAMADIFEDHLEARRKQLAEHNNPDISSKVKVKDSMCFVGWDAYQQILDTDIDIIMETCTPFIRPKHIEAAVEAGKHIFCEKPVATDTHGLQRFRKAMETHKAKGLSMVAGTQFRHDKARIETMEKIHGGAIGDVVGMQCYYCGSLPFVVKRNPEWSNFEYQLRNWYNYRWTCGDNIVEQAIHGIDVCNWAFNGPPASVFSSGGRAWKPEIEMYGDMYDHFSCDYIYKNAKGQDIHVAHYSRHWDNVDGRGGVQIIGSNGFSNGLDMGEKGMNDSIQEQVDLVNSIRETGPYWHDGERIANTTLTAMMGRDSAYTGRAISWEDALAMDEKWVPDDLNWDKVMPMPMAVPVPVTNPRPPLESR
ncbi:MAG: Gfo/Idh/MocA family oxidoreductase [Candidatus Hydrogenedentota bacterium]